MPLFAIYIASSSKSYVFFVIIYNLSFVCNCRPISRSEKEKGQEERGMHLLFGYIFSATVKMKD